MTSRTTDPLTVTPLVVPASLDSPDAAMFLEMVRISNATARHDAGHPYLDEDAQESLGFWHDTADWTHVGFAAERAGRIIGVASLTLANEEDATTAEFDISIDPDHWDDGAQEPLLAAAEQAARELGRTTMQTWTLHRPDTPGPVLPSPTGFGSVPADDRQTVFFREHGYTLEQVERNSSFDLHGSFELIESMLGQAMTAAGDQYRLVEWTSPTPQEHLDTFAYTLSRMSTDAPLGGLVGEEQRWDADRVRRRDDRLRNQGLTVSVAAVQHVATGAIVAYNELVIATDRTSATQQYGTLVLKEHRGHRLGTLVKCANLLRWRGLVPESPRVSTFNAEENRPMLDINEAIGFVPISYAGAWQKELT